MIDPTATKRGLRERWLPHPLLTAVLTGFFLLLLNRLSMGGLVLGLLLGILIPLYTTNFWPTPPRIKNWPAAAGYFFLVLWDIAVANVQVAYWILFWKNEQLQPKFFTVPLDIRVPEGIATLAGTITLTPTTGKPINPPFGRPCWNPLSQALMYSVGIEPPRISLTNSYSPSS